MYILNVYAPNTIDDFWMVACFNESFRIKNIFEHCVIYLARSKSQAYIMVIFFIMLLSNG